MSCPSYATNLAGRLLRASRTDPEPRISGEFNTPSSRQLEVFAAPTTPDFISVRLLLLLGMVSASACNLSGASPPKGRAIYQKLCVECHGRNGEGVKGKYDDGLYGDWSLEKLTRYIDKSMPEEAPEKCVGADAAAVAKHIYDAFYSREARERNTPPRVELVRLTNKQYVNAIADLLLRWTEPPDSNPGKPGLDGRYYGSKDFRQDRKLFDRTDTVLHYDFMESGHSGTPLGTNELSVQWRGSLIAEESGDYEFFLRAANGTRLWVNDRDNPAVDAWVASGDGIVEHRAVVRLAGGRSYPLRLDFFRLKDPKAFISLEWKPPHGARQPIPQRHLSTTRSSPHLILSTPFPPDDHSVGYERGVSISKEWDAATTQSAVEVAEHVTRNLDRYSRSKPSDTNRSERVEGFCREFVAAAFRGRLAPEEVDRYVAPHFKPNTAEAVAVKRIVLLTLKSPNFLYLGLPAGRGARDHEVAARLSFGLWDSLPDETLRRAADSGSLRTRDQISSQARRLLQDSRARAKVQQFLHHWLQMNHVEDLAKDSKLYPGFTPEIVADLRTSLNLFLDDVVWSRDSDYRQLLLADHLFLNARLAGFYGMNADTTGEFVRVSFDPAQRAGVVTHPYLLSAFSYQRTTSPIHRGVFLTRNIVGRALKPPPVAVAFKDADFSPNMTMREKVAELTRPQACQTCHSVINPLGFSLEHYDAVGRFRTRDGDQLVNAISEYITDEGETIRLAGGRDVAEFAARSEHAQRGFIEQLFHAIVKQPVMAYGPGTMKHLLRRFADSGFNIQGLVVEIATLSALQVSEPPPSASRKS